MWYSISNIEQFDTPFLAIYPDRAESNIDKLIARVADPSLLRPHVKTNKIPEVCRMMLDKGIRKFKCATIAEAEMLAMIGAPDILLAYQPVGPKVLRFLTLQKTYPNSSFSCVVDDLRVASKLSEIFSSAGMKVRVFIDLNTGMNRTGTSEATMFNLVDAMMKLQGIELAGIHAYDGHVKEREMNRRQQMSDDAYRVVEILKSHMTQKSTDNIVVVAGGSPSFATHLGRNVEYSPGTFVFWDWGYRLALPEEPYEFAALVMTRVISIVDEQTITTDLGYKSVASEGPLPRLHFLNAPGARHIMQSEEHLTLNVEDSSAFAPGDVLYGVPLHICPTVALYDEVFVVKDNSIVTTWVVTARKRKITI